jgi:hypothetical protein
MIDHRYISEMSRALHIFRDFSYLCCAVITFIRVVTVARTAAVRMQHARPRFRDQTGHQEDGYRACR